MDGFPDEQGRELIFRAYVEALGESPETYRESAKEVEAWASGLDATSLITFKDREGPVDKFMQVRRGWEKRGEGRGEDKREGVEREVEEEGGNERHEGWRAMEGNWK